MELATMIFVRRSWYFALWLCTSGRSVTWASLSSDGATPSARYSHSMTALEDGTAVLFGGYGDDGYLNDVYTLTVSGTSATWASLSSDGDTPSVRYRHSMTALAGGTAVLFGGYDGGFLNDVYTLTVSGTRATWVSLSSDGDTPSARYAHSMTALADGTLVLRRLGWCWVLERRVHTGAPIPSPTPSPTASPTVSPTASPTVSPTASPTASPTVSPTASPTASPTTSPTASPTASPMASPTALPTASPSPSPTPWPACVDGELDPSWISADAVIDGEWTCDAYSTLGDLCANEEI